MPGPLVSVCVPCYNRPEMTRQLISSVLKQSYDNIELVISDDTQHVAVSDMVSRFGVTARTSIVYRQNTPGLGYARNLRQALLLATGEIIIVLGDDDMFASELTVERYVAAFLADPEIGYVYANQVQMSADLGVDRLWRLFPKDVKFARGVEAFENILSTSIFIPGMAFRNDPAIERWFPSEVLLFPQMALIGHIIARSPALGISEILIAGRAHQDQLGFHAIKGERIEGTEKHGSLESLEILERLIGEYGLDTNSEFLERHLCDALSVSALKEALVVGKKLARANCRAFIKASPIAQKSLRLRASLALLSVCPVWMLRLLRSSVLTLARRREPDTYRKLAESLRKLSA